MYIGCECVQFSLLAAWRKTGPLAAYQNFINCRAQKMKAFIVRPCLHVSSRKLFNTFW
jgi:hypothetical protein